MVSSKHVGFSRKNLRTNPNDRKLRFWPPLPAALDCRSNAELFHRARRKDCREHRQAPRVLARGLTSAMDLKSQIKRVPGLRKAVHIVRKATSHPSGDPYTHWARIVMDQETDRLIRGLDLAHSSALEISGQKWRGYGFRHYTSVNFQLSTSAPVYLVISLTSLSPSKYSNISFGLTAQYAMCSRCLLPKERFCITTPFLIKDLRCSARLLAMDGSRNSTSACRGWIRYQPDHNRIMG